MLDSVVPTVVRKSIVRKFVVLTVLLAVLVGGVGFYTEQRVSGLVEESVRSELTIQAEQQAYETEQWFDSYKQSARLISQRSLVDSGNSANGVITSELVDLPDDAHAIHVVDLPRGEYVASTNFTVRGTTFDDSRYTWVDGSDDSERLVFNDWTDVAVSDVYEHNGRQLISFATPTEEMTTVVIVTVDVAKRSTMFETTSNESYVQIVDQAGRVRLSQRTGAIGSTYADSANVSYLQRGLDGSTGLSETDTGLIVAYAPVENSELVALVHQPKAEAYAVTRAVDQSLVLLTGMSLFGFALFGLTFGRSTIGSMRRLRGRATQLAAGDLDAQLETDRIDEMADVYDAFDEMRTELRERIERSEAFTQALETKADEYGAVMDRAADGDFTVRTDPDSESEAMVTVGEQFNLMMDEIEETMRNIRRFAEAVDDTSQTVASGARGVTESGQKVSQATDEIATGTASQHELLTEISAEMDDLSASVEEVAAQTDELSTRSRSAAALGDESRQSALEALDTLDEMTTVADATRETVEALEAEVEGITEIVETIGTIAEQTNILALNASIEAARAGEAGEGFAVVADEVKSLAEETSERTDDIAESIGHVTVATAEAVENVETMQTRVDCGADTIEAAMRDLEEVVERIDDVNAGIQTIDDATEHQAESAQEVASLSDQVATIGEQTSSEATDAAGAAAAQSDAIDEIHRDIEGLSDRARELSALIDSFELSDDVDA